MKISTIIALLSTVLVSTAMPNHWRSFTRGSTISTQTSRLSRVSKTSRSSRGATTSVDDSDLPDSSVLSEIPTATAIPTASATPTAPAAQSSATVATSSAAAPQASGSYWKPQIGSSWLWQLQDTIDYNTPALVFDIDVQVYGDANLVHSGFGGNLRKIICYVNVGTIELDETRDDAAAFPASVRGNQMSEWTEDYLDIRSPIVRTAMLERFKKSLAAGCDAIEPDNTDSYTANSGFALTVTDQIEYLEWISTQVHGLGMAVGLKNNNDLILSNPEVVSLFDYALVEECSSQSSDGYDQCKPYTAFIKQNKPVFAAEYQNDESLCTLLNTYNFEGMLKDIELTAWSMSCQKYDPTTLMRTVA